jgi:hypothetical protein
VSLYITFSLLVYVSDSPSNLFYSSLWMGIWIQASIQFDISLLIIDKETHLMTTNSPYFFWFKFDNIGQYKDKFELDIVM